MKFKINSKTKKLDFDDPSEPTVKDIENRNYKSLLIEIDELSKGL